MDDTSERNALDLSKLSPSEREVLEHARTGASGSELAGQLSVSEATVRTHLSHIYEKLGVRGRVDLLARLQGIRPATATPIAEHPGPERASADDHTEEPQIFPSSVGFSVIGLVAGIILGFGALPLTARNPAVMLIPVLAGAPLALVLARRPGGLHFFAAVAGGAGAILVALSLVSDLSCPAGEFSSECVGPAIAPILLPGLALVVVGLLISSWAKHRPARRRTTLAEPG